jgi:predicted lysophospholipase L1 biosynthesis ABC-type transport system permease subunit
MGEGNGGQFITLYEAKELMVSMLADYESKIVNPRHLETQNALKDIQTLIQQGSGAVKLAGVLGSVASVLWIILQIVHATKS